MFKFRFRSNPEFVTPIDFCYFPDRDMIRKECNVGWIDNYVLYMAANASDQTITLYNFYPSGTYSSNLFLTDDIDNKHHYTLSFKLYIPGNNLDNIF